MSGGASDGARDRLVRRRVEVRDRLDEVERTLVTVRDARSDGTADDEHDPEGPTMSMEWSRAQGARESLLAELAALDRAMARAEAGDYGTCANCGSPIGDARLTARPDAELCIVCATAAEAR